jgi:hypothetical protein
VEQYTAASNANDSTRLKAARLFFLFPTFPPFIFLLLRRLARPFSRAAFSDSIIIGCLMAH